MRGKTEKGSIRTRNSTHNESADVVVAHNTKSKRVVVNNNMKSKHVVVNNITKSKRVNFKTCCSK